MAFPRVSTSIILAVGLLCALSELRLSAGRHHEVADISGKWGVETYFQAGDSLSFGRHAHGAPVHEVTREHYMACKVGKPMRTYEGRDSVVRLDAPATHYYVSGDSRLCVKGKKLMVVVLATAPAAVPAASPPTTGPAPTAVIPPPPAATPPAATPPVATPAPSASPPTPSPIASSPSSSQAPASAPAEGPSVASPPSPLSALSPGSSPAVPPAPSAAPSSLSLLASLLILCAGLLALA